MNIPNHAAAGNAAAALDLHAAAGNALSPGHTPDAPGGPATGAGFLALVQQALGVQQPGAGCPTAAADVTPEGSPDLNPDLNPGMNPNIAPNVSSDVELVETEQNPKTEQNPTAAPPPTLLDPIYAALVANFSPLPSSLPGPMTAPKNSAPVLTLVQADGAPDGQQVAAAATTIGEGKRAEKAGQIPSPEQGVVPPVGATQGEAPATNITTSSTSGGTLSHDNGSPSPETQAPAGVDGPEPAAAVDGPGTRGARDERNGGLAAAGFGPAAPEGAGISASPPNIQSPQAVTTVPTTQVTTASEALGANPVTTQVVDRITSLVSANGTHRITLDLNPDDLGQVRVVMTVRDGAVHVRLAAGERDTRAALVEGSDELRSLLGLAGATDAKITIRELGNAFGTQLQNQSQHQDPQAQQHAQGGQGRGDQDQHAGTRATYDPATDGTTTSHRDSGAGATGTRSSETVSSNRSPGLDVTM